MEWKMIIIIIATIIFIIGGVYIGFNNNMKDNVKTMATTSITNLFGAVDAGTGDLQPIITPINTPNSKTNIPIHSIPYLSSITGTEQILYNPSIEGNILTLTRKYKTPSVTIPNCTVIPEVFEWVLSDEKDYDAVRYTTETKEINYIYWGVPQISHVTVKTPIYYKKSIISPEERTCVNVTYFYPPTISIKTADKEEDLLSAQKTDVIQDKETLEMTLNTDWAKIGDTSVIIGSYSAYNSTFTNATQNDNFVNINLSSDFQDGNLLVYMPFDADNTTRMTDISGKGHHGTKNGQVFINGSGKYMNASQYDGITDYLTITRDTSLSNYPKGITVMGWFKSDWANGESIASQYDQASPNTKGWAAFIDNGLGSDLILWQLRLDNVCCQNTYSTVLPSNDWNHLAFTYDPVQGSVIYINGHNDSSDPSIGVLDSTDNVYIGGYSDAPASSNYNGKIDEFMIFNRTLSASEIASYYSGGKNRLVGKNNQTYDNSSYNLAYWKFNNNTVLGENDSKVVDQLSRMNGTCSGTTCPNWSQTNVFSNRSLLFDGVDDYLNFSSQPKLKFNVTQPHTISFWAYPTNSIASSKYILGYVDGDPTAGAPGWLIRQINDVGEQAVEYCMVSKIGVNPEYTCIKSEDDALNNNIWSFITLTYNGTNTQYGRRLYINGIFQSQADGFQRCGATAPVCSAVTTPSYTQAFIIGGSNWVGNDAWAGQIDELAIWNRTLSSGEVSALFLNQSLKHGYANSEMKFNGTINLSTAQSVNITIQNLIMYNGTNVSVQINNGTEAFFPSDGTGKIIDYNTSSINNLNASNATFRFYSDPLDFFTPYISGNISFLFAPNIPATVYPSFSNNQTNATFSTPTNGSVFQINITITDSNGLSFYRLTQNDTSNGAWANETIIQFGAGITSTTVIFNYTIGNFSAIGGTFGWRVWANDTAGNINISEIYTQKIYSSDSIPPTYTNFINNGSTVTRINGIVNWSATLADNVGLNTYRFAHNQSGSLINLTPVTISGASVFVNNSLTITKTRGNYICGQYWFNDTSGNVNQTNLSCFSVANSPPLTPNITYPINGSSYITVTQINYTSSDADNDLITYNTYINRTLNFTSTANISGWNASDGYYILNVSASDGFDSSSSNASISFSIDSDFVNLHYLLYDNTSTDRRTALWGRANGTLWTTFASNYYQSTTTSTDPAKNYFLISNRSTNGVLGTNGIGFEGEWSSAALWGSGNPSDLLLGNNLNGSTYLNPCDNCFIVKRYGENEGRTSLEVMSNGKRAEIGNGSTFVSSTAKEFRFYKNENRVIFIYNGTVYFNVSNTNVTISSDSQFGAFGYEDASNTDYARIANIHIIRAGTLASTPTIYNFSNNGSLARINGTINFSAIFRDDINEIDTYIFAHNQSGTLTNLTPIKLNPVLRYYANQTIKITLGNGNNICGQFWINNTRGTVKQSELSCFTVLNTPPSTPTIFSPYNEEKNTTRKIEYSSPADLDGDTITYWVYINGVLNSSGASNISIWNGSDGYYSLNVSASDGFATSANATVYFTLDTKPPSFSNSKTNATGAYITSVQLNITISENLNLSHYRLSHNDTAGGTWTNESLISVSGTTAYPIFNYTILNFFTGGTMGWKVWSNDTTGNVNISDIYTFDIASAPVSASILGSRLIEYQNITGNTNTIIQDNGAVLIRWLVINYTHTPLSPSDTCTYGEQAWDITYEYRCIATNTWQRWVRATW